MKWHVQVCLEISKWLFFKSRHGWEIWNWMPQGAPELAQAVLLEGGKTNGCYLDFLWKK